MQGFVNRHLFGDTVDSRALTVPAMVFHHMAESGEYSGTVFQGARETGSFRLKVGAGPGQVNIDLANLAPVYEVGAGGYAVFHVSGGSGGFAAVIAREGYVFDTRKLQAGDLFAVTLMRPGAYTVRNEVTGETARVLVAGAAADSLAFNITVTDQSMSPQQVEVAGGQGIVFRLEAPAALTLRSAE